MHSHYTNKLLDIEDVIIKNIRHADTFVKIYLETKPHEQVCPCCGAVTKRIHDYRYQTIKDLPFQLKHCYLVLHKRRYVCKCGKRFYVKETTRQTTWAIEGVRRRLQKTMPARLRKYYKLTCEELII